MFFASLSLAEFLALFGGLAAAVTALYLVDRTRRRRVVATLLFWRQAQSSTESRRWRIRQPLSLLLQLLSIAALLLAVGALRIGSPVDTSRDHVLLLDSSAWMAARSGQGTLMDEARSAALAYVRALPPGDRVMVVRASLLATPVTAFEANRTAVERAIRGTTPGAGAMHLERALAFARRILALEARRPGEIVFAGSGRLARENAPRDLAALPANFRYLPVSQVRNNVGIKSMALRHSAAAGNIWKVYLAVHNYGDQPRTTDLALEFAGSPAAFRHLYLAPGADTGITIPLRTQAAGVVEAHLFASDAFAGDNDATLEIPSARPVPVTVFSAHPKLLRPLFAANPMVKAVYKAPRQYGKTNSAIVVIDSFHPPFAPGSDTIWITPPPGAAGVRVTGTVHNALVKHWRPNHPLTEGLRTQDLELAASQVYRQRAGDIAVAEVAEGPVILARGGAREGSPKTVILGFNPARSAVRYELAAPLLFANIIRWMRPDVFRPRELSASSPGTLTVDLPERDPRSGVRVFSEDGQDIPFTIEDHLLRFFDGAPDTVVVRSGKRELIYSLTLPAVPETIWKPPASVARGIPAGTPREPASRGIWQWLALLGAAGLLVEWMWFGRFPKRDRPASGHGGSPAAGERGAS